MTSKPGPARRVMTSNSAAIADAIRAVCSSARRISAELFVRCIWYSR